MQTIFQLRVEIQRLESQDPDQQGQIVQEHLPMLWRNFEFLSDFARDAIADFSIYRHQMLN